MEGRIIDVLGEFSSKLDFISERIGSIESKLTKNSEEVAAINKKIKINKISAKKLSQLDEARDKFDDMSKCYKECTEKIKELEEDNSVRVKKEIELTREKELIERLYHESQKIKDMYVEEIKYLRDCHNATLNDDEQLTRVSDGTGKSTYDFSSFIEIMKLENESLNKSVAALQQELSDLKETSNDLSLKEQVTRSEYNILLEKYSDLEKANKTLVGEYDDKLKQLDALDTISKQQSDINKELEKKIDELSKSRDALNQELSAISGDYDKQAEELKYQNTLNKKLESTIASLRNKNQVLIEQNESFSAKNRKLAEEIMELQDSRGSVSSFVNAPTTSNKRYLDSPSQLVTNSGADIERVMRPRPVAGSPEVRKKIHKRHIEATIPTYRSSKSIERPTHSGPSSINTYTPQLMPIISEIGTKKDDVIDVCYCRPHFRKSESAHSGALTMRPMSRKYPTLSE